MKYIEIFGRMFDLKTKRPIRVDEDGKLVSHSATTIGDNRKTVTTAATCERLVTGPTLSSYVIITAELDNTGVIAVGGSTVVAALATRRGTPLEAGDSCLVLCNNLYDIFLDATVSGDGVTFTYGD